MDRSTVMIACIAPLALVNLAGHCGPACGSEGVSVEYAEGGGNVTWTRDGEQNTAELVSLGELFANQDDPASDCSIGATIGSQADGAGATSTLLDVGGAVAYGSFDVECFRLEGFTERNFRLSIATSDPRVWDVGEVPAEQVAATAVMWSQDDCETGDCRICRGDAIAVAVTVVVESRSGGPAPHPDGVTDDFAMTFRLDFDTVEPVVSSGSPSGPACDHAIEAAGSVTLSWDAADFNYDDGC